MTPGEQALVERAAAAPMLDQVLAWSAINSGSSNLAGLATMAGLLADAFSVLPGDLALVAGGPVARVDAAGEVERTETARHIHLTVRPSAPVQLILTGHMDTVFPVDHAFQHTRWLDEGPILNGSVLNGPGVADMKGGIAIMLAALAAFEAGPDSALLGYEVILNADEETGSASSAPLIAACARGKRAGLTYEPSALPDGTLAGERPGTGNFSIIVTGRAAHAGRNPLDGRNALLAAADIALRLAALRHPGLSVNPARIDGGGPNNVVPDKAVLRVNLRPATAADQEEAGARLHAIARAVEADHDVAVHVHGSFGRPPKPMTPPALALFETVKQCGAELGLAIGWQPTGGVCDGNNIAATGVPVVDTLGARGGAIHSPEEYLLVESLAERARLSALLLSRLAHGATT